MIKKLLPIYMEPKLLGLIREYETLNNYNEHFALAHILTDLFLYANQD